MASEPTSAMQSLCVDSHGSAIGMPQLCGEWMPNQIFWLVVTLIVIFFVLSRVALPRISGILADRQGTITSDIAAAEDLRQKAVDAERAYDEALAAAKAEAARIAAQLREEIDRDLAAAVAKADAVIAAKATESEARLGEIRANALEVVAEVAKSTAKDLVVAMGGKADARSVTAAVNARLKG